MTAKAICCCNACSVEVEGELVLNAICHCANCKRRTGSAFGWSVYVADSQVVRRDGEFRVYDIAGACFVGDKLPQPSVTVSNDGRCDWLGLPMHWRTSL